MSVSEFKTVVTAFVDRLRRYQQLIALPREERLVVFS